MGQPSSATTFPKWHREAFKSISWLYTKKIDRALCGGFMKTGNHILGSEQHATGSSMNLLVPDEDLHFTIHSNWKC